MADKILVLGLYANPPRDKAPSFVKGSVNIKLDQFIEFAKNHVDEKGYVKIDILEKKGDTTKWNGFLNDYVKSEQPQQQTAPIKEPVQKEPDFVQRRDDDLF